MIIYNNLIINKIIRDMIYNRFDNVIDNIIDLFRYRIKRFKKMTKNRYYIAIRYLIILYTTFKVKIGWY